MSSPFFKHKVLPVIQNIHSSASSSFSNGQKDIISNSSGTGNLKDEDKLPHFDSIKIHALKIGHLKKLVGRGLLSAGTWKDRMVVLYQDQLFLYETTELSSSSSNPGSESCGIGTNGSIIPLGGYDLVTEAPTRVTRKAANVFLLGRSDKGFFDTSSRHYFAAKSLTEMKDWVSKVRKVLGATTTTLESSGKENYENSSHQSNKTNKKQKMGNSSNGSGDVTAQEVSTLEEAGAGETESNHDTRTKTTTLVKTKMGDSTEERISTTLPRGKINSGIPAPNQNLDVELIKSRVKGPTGRRLPRSRSPNNRKAHYPTSPTDSNSSISSSVYSMDQFRDSKGRATSLSALEMAAAAETPRLLRPSETRTRIIGWNRNHRSSSIGSTSTTFSKGLESIKLGSGNGESNKSFDNENFPNSSRNCGGGTGSSRSSRGTSVTLLRNGHGGHGKPANCRNSRYVDTTSSDSGDDTVEEKNMTVVVPKENLLQDGNTNTNPTRIGTGNNSTGSTNHEFDVDPESSLSIGRAIPGPQVKATTPNSLRLSRRGAGNMSRGGTPVRTPSTSSTMSMSTPPPCLLRKLRREMSQERNNTLDSESMKSEDNSWKRCSINGNGSSTSADDEQQQNKHNSPFLSLRRTNHQCINNPNRVSLPQFGHSFHKHGTMSETASPIINGRYSNSNNNDFNKQMDEFPYHNNNGRSLQQLSQIPHPIETSIDEIRNEIGVLNQDTRKIDLDLAFLREDVGSVHEDVSDLKGTVENTREKITRITVQLANAERQIGAAVKEANVLREESFKLLQSAQSSKETQEQLTSQIQNLFEYMKSISEKFCTSSSGGLGIVKQPHQHICYCSTNSKDCENTTTNSSRLLSLSTIIESPSSASIPNNGPLMRHQCGNSDCGDSNSELNSSDNDCGESSSIIEKSTYHKS